jgi:acyl-CoA synthetase (NDP forming)
MFKIFNELIINYETLKYLGSEYKEIKMKSRVTEKETRRREKKEGKTDRRIDRKKEIIVVKEGRRKDQRKRRSDTISNK